MNIQALSTDPSHASELAQDIGRSVAEVLLSDDLLAKVDSKTLARSLPKIMNREFSAGATVYEAGEKAEHFYLLLDGTVKLISPQGRESSLKARHFGEEAGSHAAQYLTTAVAATPVKALAIPRVAMRDLVNTAPALRTELLLSLGSHLTGENLVGPTMQTVVPKLSRVKPRRITGWILALVLPWLTLQFGSHLNIPRSSVMFLAIFAATVVMWMFTLVDDYIPGLFLLLATLVTGLVPAPVILSGFASDGFLMALSTLALGTVVVTSGLSYRVMLILLRRLPNTQFWHNLGLYLVGTVLTPIIPTANGRITLVSPFYSDMVDSLQLKLRGKAATCLAVSCFSGVSLFSAIFLTSKSVNFAIFGLMSSQQQDHFQWVTWTATASVAGLVLLLVNAVAAALWFRNKERPQLPKDRIDEQLALLGRLRTREWAAVGGTAFLVVGLVTSSVHKVQPPWLGLAMLFGLLLCGVLNKNELRERVDWTFLLYLSGVTGMVATFNALGLDRELGNAMPGLREYVRSNFSLFVLLLFAIVNVMRLAVPPNAVAVILATIMMPVAELGGINSWVVGFIILVFAETWFFPYQCSYYVQLQERLDYYDERSFLWLNALMNLARLGAIYASVPFWKMLGIL